MIKIEVELINGSKYTIDYDQGEEEFKDLIKFDNGTNFLQDSQKGYILVKNVVRFKIAE